MPRRITKAEIVELGGDQWGVRYEFDDGWVSLVHVNSKAEAVDLTKDRIGEPVGFPGSG